jgi:hypothetical protein
MFAQRVVSRAPKVGSRSLSASAKVRIQVRIQRRTNLFLTKNLVLVSWETGTCAGVDRQKHDGDMSGVHRQAGNVSLPAGAHAIVKRVSFWSTI